MNNILITGATGNVGIEVIKSLNRIDQPFNITAGVRNPEKDAGILAAYKASLQYFDFTNITSFRNALQYCDILFLMRPPQLADVNKYFLPLISMAKKTQVRHIVFLSVQGVENNTFIPHYKIEKLIADNNIPYTFLRPAYFMQNFITTLHSDLVKYKRIFLPAGHANFTLVDVRDIGNVAAEILTNATSHINKAYDLTSHEKLTFREMAGTLSDKLGIDISYRSPGLIQFYRAKRKERMPPAFILIMIMLHYLPRFQKEPLVSNWVEQITGTAPTSFEQFVDDNKLMLR